MFQFGGFPPHGYGFTLRYRRITPVGFPIQISADHLVFANPRRFSQLITSFFGSQCLGIHPVLFSLNHSRISPGETLACVSLSFSLRMSPPAASDVLLFDCNMRFSRYDTDSRRYPISAPKTKLLAPGSKGTEILSMPLRHSIFPPLLAFHFQSFRKGAFQKTNDAGPVEIKGFEPLTPCLQGRCSPN